jgi:hypothetical protein
MDEGFDASTRRFPFHTQAIESLAARGETLRKVGVDYGDVKAELARWEAPMDPKRDERCSVLSKEIEEAPGGPAQQARHTTFNRFGW